MKRRIISLLMAALMLVSLAPFGAMAAGIGDIIGGGSGSTSKITVSITKQPESVTVAAGETATFTIETQVDAAYSRDVKYVWLNATDINSGSDLSLTDILGLVKNAVGTEQTLTIENVTADHNGNQYKCIAYCGGLSGGLSKGLGYAISNAATLTVSGVTPTPTPTATPAPSTSPTPTATPAPSTSPAPTASPSTCTHASLEHYAKSDGTCNPHIEYWYCPDCGKYFTDAACTNEIRKSKLDNGVEKDETNHTDLKRFIAKAATCTEEGNVEYWYCSGCDNYYSNSSGTAKTTHAKVTTSKADHDYYWVADTTANVHYQKCRVCDKTTATSSHTGGTASCKAKAECSKCGASYGDFDADNHINFEYKNAVKPTATTKGYTGDKYCADCGAFIEKGTEYAPQCSGGCKDLKLVKGTPKTCTADGTIDYYQCPTCQNKYKDEKGTVLLTEEDLIDKCTGHDLHPGTDLFADISKDNLKQFAKELGMSTPEIVEMIRNGTFSMENIIGSVKIKDIDHCSDDTYHWLGCQRCGKTLEDLREELEASGFTVNEKWYELSKKTPHSGGTATCKDKAVCDECGEAYGKLADHRYKAVVTAPTCTSNGYTTYTCASCGSSYKDSETVKTGHIIKYGVCESCKGRFSNPFYDVNGSDWFYSAVMWAYYNEPRVTTGVDASHFRPKASCTRAQVVTFLWRAAGEPEPASSTMKFSDVPYNNSYAPYYKAIIWATEQGITTGTGDGSTFSPNATVTRAQFVTFLWRYAGEPSPSNMSTAFNDVSANSVYYKAILWAAENGITNGKTTTQFAPNAACTRCEVVSFMFRAFSSGTVN